VEIITLSTNPWDGQAAFAKKARISNITFLSDAPSFEFGKRTGLLLPMYRILHRAVIVADAENVIRYVQLVPMGELPNFDATYDAARRLAAAR
jgi:thiol peroxidase